jgi:octaprenyl-diphosphate synthase
MIKNKLQIFLNPLHEIKSLLKEDLTSIDQIIVDCTNTHDSLIQTVTEYNLNAGGKRIRPILVVLTAKLFDLHHNKDISNLAAAIELIHMASLLHDDVVDGSESRRGIKTVNFKWNNKTSILVGDFLFSKSFCLMSEVGNDEVLKLLSKTSSILSEGEIIQMQSSFDLAITLDDYLKIISSKTASLFSAACQVPALLLNKSKEEILNLEIFGTNLGMIFQLTDDLLDYQGSKKNTGKKIGSDFFEGKITIPIIIALNYITEIEKKWIIDIFDNNKRSNDDLEKILDILSKYDIYNKIAQIIDDYKIKALNSLELLPVNDISKLMKKVLLYSSQRNI